MIPRARSDVTGPLSWLAWALLGNDEGGIYGERDHFADEFKRDGPSVGLAVKWWLRNPAANFFKVVCRWPRDPLRVLAEWSSVPRRSGLRAGWAFWYLREQEKWVAPDDTTSRQFSIFAVPPGVAWRGPGGCDGYWLWHSSGWFCVLPTARPLWCGAIVYGIIVAAVSYSWWRG